MLLQFIVNLVELEGVDKREANVDVRHPAVVGLVVVHSNLLDLLSALDGRLDDEGGVKDFLYLIHEFDKYINSISTLRIMLIDFFLFFIVGTRVQLLQPPQLLLRSRS